MTITERVLNALENGEELTAKQIASRFNAANPREVVRQLRAKGYPVYLNRRVSASGNVTNKYRLGTPTRATVAAGYKAQSAGVVDLL